MVKNSGFAILVVMNVLILSTEISVRKELSLRNLRGNGVSELLSDLDLKFEESKENALIIRNSRLNTLLKFFEGLPQSPSKSESKFEVLIDKNLDKRRNVIIVGDLFLAESLAGYQGQGLKQTMFTRHAATIKKQIELFDTRFEELKNEQSGDASVEHAKAEIVKRLKKIQTKMKKKR